MYESLSVVYTSVVKIEVGYSASQGKNPKANPNVTMSLSSSPIIGRDPVHPSHLASQATEQIVVFTLDRDDVPRFHEALKSRGLVRFAFRISISRSDLICL